MTLIRKGSEVDPPKAPRCRRCFKPIREDGHKGYCSSDCFQAESQDVSQAKLRALVFARDKGNCSGCGMRTEDVAADLATLRRESDMAGRHRGNAEASQRRNAARNALEARIHFLVRLGFPRGPVENGETLWQADHVHEKAAGGPNSLSNMATRCLACHGKKTTNFAKKRAKNPRPKNRGMR